MEFITWIFANGNTLLEIFGGIVAVGSLIVKLTPSTKDDGIWAIVVNIFEKVSVFNKNGTKVVKTEEK